MDIVVRLAEGRDAVAMAQAWIDAGRYYASIDARRFHVPDIEGLASWLADLLAHERDDDEIWFVAEANGRVVGDAIARIDRPAPDAGRELLRDLSEPVLRIDSIAVLEADRRLGAGTALMTAAEDWGRNRGATRAFLTTAVNSAIAVPFYEERMRYERVSLGFWKLL